jgi:hypothetical protein
MVTWVIVGEEFAPRMPVLVVEASMAVMFTAVIVGDERLLNIPVAKPPPVARIVTFVIAGWGKGVVSL